MTEYQKNLHYLFNQFPQYQKIGKKAYKSDLSNITELCKLLNNPQKDLSFIHVAGTNGKGSSSHMLASIFQEAGYNTGIFTSPHLIDFRERIKINGSCIAKQYVNNFIKSYRTAFEKIGASFFEWTTALAFYYFQQKKTDINIIETGLGGRLDSTNIIEPEICIITTVGLDHQNILGKSLEEIAQEKAGIIKENIPVVLGSQIKETLSVIKKIADRKNAPIHCASLLNLLTDLVGDHQQYNASTAYTAYQLLKEKYKLSKTHLEKGLQKVVKNTGLRGRWEILEQNPLVIADIGHNQQAFEYIGKELNKLSQKKGYFIFGLSDDKDLQSILPHLPKNMDYIITQPDNPRAMNAHKLNQLMEGFEIKDICKDFKQAYLLAKDMAKNDDLIFIGGSAFFSG